MNFSRLFKHIFILLAILGSLPFFVFAQVPNCDPKKEQCFEAKLPGIEGNSIDAFVQQDRPLSRYVGFIVNIATAAIVIIGLISIVVGGYFYITAGGSSDSVGRAKTWIFSALFAIALALTAWIILNTINPQITNVNL